MMMKHPMRAILTRQNYHRDPFDGRGMAWGASFRHCRSAYPALTMSFCQPITSGQTLS
jgi:hypothetical protein